MVHAPSIIVGPQNKIVENQFQSPIDTVKLKSDAIK